MSEEQTQIQSWPDPPTAEEISNMSDEEVDTAIAKTVANMRIPGHPMHGLTLNNPMTKVHVKSREMLFERKYPDNTPEHEKIMAQGLKESEQRQADEQADRVAEAKKDMDVLEEKYDFNRIDIPDDIPEYRARSIREQKFLAGRNINELQPMLLRDLQSLKAPPDKIEMLSGITLAYYEDRLDEQQIQNAKTLIKWIIDENVKKEIKDGNRNT